MSSNRSESDVDRRQFLQTTGAIAGVSAFDADGLHLDLTDTAPLADTLFVEILLEHEGTPDTPIVHNDGFLDYAVDPGTRQMVLTPFADADAVATVRDHDAVVSSDGYRPAPGVAIDRPQSRLLTVAQGRDGTPAKQLQLETEYAPPQVTVDAVTGDAVTVSSAERDVVVPADEAATLHLDPRTVEVSRPTDSFREAPDTRTGGTTLRREYQVEAVDVTPRVSARNYGRIDVFEHERGGE